jgi:beta-fructofuranosidase
VIECGEFEPIYDPSVGEDERWYINDHTFIRDRAGLWHLIGITHAEPAQPFEEKHLAHATASSLHGPWTKQPYALSYDPDRGEKHLWAPHVIAHDGRYWMFVCGGGEPTSYMIQLATSEDCVTWERHPACPLVVDGYEARDPMVLRVGDRWLMYYTATSEPEGGHHVVVATESDDLVHWHGRTIVYTDVMTGTGAGPTESPFVVERGDRYFLFIGPDWDTQLRRYNETGKWGYEGYRATRVIVSDNPLHFDIANLVTTINAHAAEVVVDEHGDTWVSHCGWGQGGVYLAPLRFGEP